MSFERQLTFEGMMDFQPKSTRHSSTFLTNMSRPVHRWFRYSAGFSADWVEATITEIKKKYNDVCVLDPFAGSATTIIAAEDVRVASLGIESHPFVARVAKSKLLRKESPEEYRTFAALILRDAKKRKRSDELYPELIQRCYHENQLDELDRLRCSFKLHRDDSPASELTWLTLVSILRMTSHVGTAQWQYILPNKSKTRFIEPFDAFAQTSRMIWRDMLESQDISTPGDILTSDARTCEGVADDFANLVITSPPYPNNYDYADSTRLEMMFMREIDGWGDLNQSVRQHLVRSCTQHTTTKTVDLDQTLRSVELMPIREELESICQQLGEIRLSKGGKKNYHLMISSYFLDLAKVWISLRRVCRSPSKVCFVIGDSAPYGVSIPVYDWMGRLAISAGFHNWRFEKIRDRNVKWKNRKHRVPLSEGHLWVDG
jgi:hypothetical protein